MQEDTFQTLCTALADATDFFTTGVIRGSSGTPLTQQQAVDILDVYKTLLNASESEQGVRLFITQRTLETDFFQTLLRLVAEPLRHVHEMDAQLQQPFLPLRVSVVQSLHQLMLGITDDLQDLQHLFLAAATQSHLLPTLLHLLRESPYDALRVSVAEALFVFILRLGSSGAALFVGENGVSVVLAAVLSESSAFVRSIGASILREVVGIRPECFTDVASVTGVLKLLSGDSSPDVRVLAAEIMEQSMRLAPGSIAYLLQDPRSLLLLVQAKFAEDASVEVVEACGRLLESSCEVAAAMNIHSFFATVVPMGMVGTLVRRLRAGTNGAAACARGLRFLLQYTPCQYELPLKLLHDDEALPLFMKAIVDAGHGKTTNDEEFSVFQVKCVELALSVSIIMCQSPAYREFLAREFEAFPVWAASLKNAVVSFINSASLDYFAAIELTDITGVHLNSLHTMEWSDDDKPRKELVHGLFRDQEERVRGGGVAHRHQILPAQDPSNDVDMRRKVRLTFIILVYAVHLTFAVDSGETIAAIQQRGPAGSAARSSPSPSRALVAPGGCVVSPGSVGAASPTLRQPVFPSSPPPQRQPSQDPEMRLLLEGRGSVSAMAKAGLLVPNDREALAVTYDKFDSSLKLALQLSEHYQKKKRNEDMYLPATDGYTVRVAKLKNPWRPMVKNDRLKTWAVQDVRQGDLFYFAVPFDEIDESALATVLTMARRHAVLMKKEIVTTPQTAKARRWFLYDMLNNILPRVFAVLEELLALVRQQGSSNVRFPVFLFREKEMHLGERALHPGNLLEVADQVKFYFSQKPADLFGMDSERIQRLAAQLEAVEKDNYEYDPRDDDVALMEHVDDDDDDDDDVFGQYGHGTISSESDGDDD